MTLVIVLAVLVLIQTLSTIGFALMVVLLMRELRAFARVIEKAAPIAAELEQIVEPDSPPLSPLEQARAFSEGVAVARIAESVLPSSTVRR
jgi:hypothetical protein